jgi:hypothetical protein
MPNPAAVFCVKSGGTDVIREGAGGQYGGCILPDGTEVDAWEYFRKQRQAVRHQQRRVSITRQRGTTPIRALVSSRLTSAPLRAVPGS